MGNLSRRNEIALVVLLGILLSIAVPRIVQAHANLVRSEPAADEILGLSPDELRLWFSEAIDVQFSQVQIYDKQGQALKGNPISLHGDPGDDTLLVAPISPLPNGIYTVAWRTSSAVDGHITAGSFLFVIGQEQVFDVGAIPLAPNAVTSSSGPTLPEVVTRWLGYLALAILAGGFGFVPLVLRPALGNVKPLPDPDSLFSRLFWPLLICALLAAATTLAAAVLQAAKSSSVEVAAVIGSPLVSYLTTTRYGVLFWLRMALLAVVVILLLYRKSSVWRPALNAIWWWAGSGVTALILLTTSLDGHAAALSVLAVAADWLHLLAVGAWAGGLPILMIALSWLRSGEHGEDGLIAAFVINRFSLLATISVSILAITGLYRATIEVADWPNLIDTSYGLTLLIKLALLTPLLAIGAINFLRSRRNLAWMAVSVGERRPWHRLIRVTVSIEILLIAAILLVTGILTNLPPPRDVFGAGTIVRGQAADVRVVFVTTPAVFGLNTFNIYLRDTLGRPITDAEKVALTFGMVEHDMGTEQAVAQNQGDGLYTAQGGFASMFGTWQIQLLIRRAGQDDVDISLIVPIRAVAPPPVPPVGFSPLLVDPAKAISGIVLLIFGLGVVIAGWRVRRLRRIKWIAVAGGVVAALISLGLVGSSFVNGADPGLALRNPNPPTADSIANGKLLYGANCAVCHGDSGQGDGNAASLLNPPPTNLRTYLAQGFTDGQLFEQISQGSDNTTMPAFEGRLDEGERWDVINYLRALAGKP